MHAIQVGREMCGGTHLERNYHLRAEVKSIKVTRYREEKGNVETTKYLMGPSGSHSPLDKRSSLEETIERYLEESTKRQDSFEEWMKRFRESTDKNLKRHDSTIKGLEKKVEQLAQAVHASMTNDSKSVNQVKTVATKNSPDTHCSTSLNSNTILVSNNIEQENVMKTGESNETPRPTPVVGTFAEKVKRQTPDYTKSLQEPVSKKTRIGEVSMVKLNARCSAVLQNELPLKEKDPKSFILPCIIGNMTVSNALADLGASISVMPFSLFKRLGLGNPKPVRMLIEMADKSMQSPKGIIENVMMAFGGNASDLGSFGEETNEITDLHQILEEILLTGCEDGVTSIKRHRRDPSSDSVRRFSVWRQGP
ncbi:retrovirus-related pol polyprotein from transposon TNT 1-94 [Tanacetum coccineum]|uniref:Retrovirus-related pol polyprotein from transposon TNT 1-94 n=1 Tax=Tanacetum coccineum TaxID=301880 RepID=A0ABQ5IGV8_9ASTR